MFENNPLEGLPWPDVLSDDVSELKDTCRHKRTEREKTADEAHTFLMQRYQKLLADNRRHVSMYKGTDGGYESEQMVEALYETQRKYGEQAAWDAFAMEPRETVESAVRWEAGDWGHRVDYSDDPKFTDDAFRAEEIYTHLRYMFGTALGESLARDASGFDAEAERHVVEMCDKYPNEELHRHFAELVQTHNGIDLRKANVEVDE